MTIYAHAFWAWYPFRRRRWVWAFVAGAVLPDVPYLLAFTWMMVSRGPQSLADLGLWEDLWRSPIVVALHSFVPWLVTAGVAVLLLAALGAGRSRLVQALLAGGLTHVVVDALTHRSDGYPIFWPLSEYRFPTPISYWEPDYHGVTFAIVSDAAIALAVFRLVTLRRRSRAIAARDHPRT